ncbi:hypothetical protein [Halalkalibacillus sediminis]|uniref:hypothetical protein n=1 Tax=Halalkalibacillus sediminis TaxID=2018042 RepID=UPI00117BAD57|nr:hypothetical protein [Halalkalibacillus sediminis]
MKFKSFFLHIVLILGLVLFYGTARSGVQSIFMGSEGYNSQSGVVWFWVIDAIFLGVILSVPYLIGKFREQGQWGYRLHFLLGALVVASIMLWVSANGEWFNGEVVSPTSTSLNDEEFISFATFFSNCFKATFILTGFAILGSLYKKKSGLSFIR